VTYHHGWLMIGEENGNYAELFNHARTAAYLQSSSTLGGTTVYGVLSDGGCEGYTWMPPTTDGGTGGVWFQQTYTNPVSDGAPWYNSTFPESGEALGFWITEWTGLDSGHIKREISPVGAYRGGGQFGATYSMAREMGFEVILLAESEAAMDYLYRWLDSTLSSVCYSCQTDSILIRRICPEGTVTAGTADEGVVELRQVGMTSGLVWGSPPVEQAGCFIRRANFTLAALDPCMYGVCSAEETPTQSMTWGTCFAGDNVNEGRTDCRPSCSEMPGECRLTFDYSVDVVTAAAPRIVVTAGTADSIPMRIRTYANPNGMAPEDLCGTPLLCELYVAALPATSELLYDIAGRTVSYRSAATGTWVNGFAFVATNDVGIPRFAALGCGDFTTIVEPASFCYDGAPASTGNYADVSLVIQERMGCA
jgi:hypothetical protein